MADFTTRNLSRRDFNLLACGLLGSSLLMMSGCGGLFGGSGGGSDSFSTTGVQGSVALPAGLALENLQTTGAGSFGTLTETAFRVDVQSEWPTFVTIWDSVQQKVVLMSMVDPASGSNSIDAASTAAALMFLGLGGLSLNPGDRRALLTQINASTQVHDLTTAIIAQTGSDAYAVTHAPQALVDAIQAAVNGFKGVMRAESKRLAAEQASFAAFDQMILIEPTEEVDGLTVVQSSDSKGFQVQNVRRRFGRVITYMTAHVDKDGNETAVIPPQKVDSPVDIPLTVGLLNTSGQGWAQVISPVSPLSVDGQDKKTKYEMIALTPVFGAAPAPVYGDSKYAAEVDKWKDECGSLRQSVMLAGFMEIVLEILGLGGSSMGYATVQGAIAGLLSATQVIRAAMTSAYLGNVFYGQVIGELASKMTFEEIFLAELPILETLTLQIKGQVAANAVRNAFLRPRLLAARAALVAIVALGVIELADIIALAKDTTTGNEANKWGATVYQPEISITATQNTYKPSDQIKFTAQVPAGKKNLVYHWKASGSNLIVLDDGVTYDKLEFDSTKNLVTLTTSPSAVGALTVSCEVFDTTSGRESLGIVSKTLTQDNSGGGGGSASISYSLISGETYVSGNNYQVPFLALLEFAFDETKHTDYVMYNVDSPAIKTYFLASEVRFDADPANVTELTKFYAEGNGSAFSLGFLGREARYLFDRTYLQRTAQGKAGLLLYADSARSFGAAPDDAAIAAVRNAVQAKLDSLTSKYVIERLPV